MGNVSKLIHSLGNLSEDFLYTLISAKLALLIPALFGHKFGQWVLSIFLKPRIKELLDMGEYATIDFLTGTIVNEQEEKLKEAIKSHEDALAIGDENAKELSKKALLDAARSFGRFVQP